MQREIERIRDPFGLGLSFQRELERMRDPFSLGPSFQRELERMRDPFSLGPSFQRELERSHDVLGLGRLDDLLGRRDSTFSFAERYARGSAFASPRAFDLASTIGDLVSETTSWLAEPVTPAESPRFELGALSPQPGDGGRIEIEHEVCCLRR
jgi:hypothetical protein